MQALEIATRGYGRPVDETKPCGYWLNFSTADFGDVDVVNNFTKRRGDPFGQF